MSTPPSESSTALPEDASTPGNASDASPWGVYVLWSASLARTYVGIAQDVARRVRQHNGELVRGARATRAGRPWELRRVFGPYPDRSAAQVAEAALKRLSGTARFDFDAPRWS